MRIFNKDHKVNFVDRHNTLVGFDNHQQCCEKFGWSVSQSSGDLSCVVASKEELEPYAFDPTSPPIHQNDPITEGGSVSFLLVAPGMTPLYLTLFNHHNGYYSHGFHLDCGGKLALEGEL